jgi:hypothetical protein
MFKPVCILNVIEMPVRSLQILSTLTRIQVGDLEPGLLLRLLLKAACGQDVQSRRMRVSTNTLPQKSHRRTCKFNKIEHWKLTKGVQQSAGNQPLIRMVSFVVD